MLKKRKKYTEEQTPEEAKKAFKELWNKLYGSRPDKIIWKRNT